MYASLLLLGSLLPANVHTTTSVQTAYSTKISAGVTQTQYGSGTIIKVSPDKFWVLSCRHVTDDMGNTAGKLVVRYQGKDYPAKRLAADKEYDLSLIEVHGQIDVQPATIAETDPKPGDPVIKVGYPHAGPQVVAAGKVTPIVSMAVHNPMITSFVATAPAISGDSGGGVFCDGKLVGVIWGGRQDGLRATAAKDICQFLKRSRFRVR